MNRQASSRDDRNEAAFSEDCSPSFLAPLLHFMTLAKFLRTFPTAENFLTKIEEPA